MLRRYDNEHEFLADIDDDEEEEPVVLTDDEDAQEGGHAAGGADDEDDEQVYDFGDFFDPFNGKLVRLRCSF